MSYKVSLSVHELVDSVLRSGDIDSRVFNNATMLEGSRIHRYYQSKMLPNYKSEVFLEIDGEYEEFEFHIEGRADGIIVNEDSIIVDEIKSCVGDLDEFHEKQENWHLGQAKVYAYMYCKQHNIKIADVVLTYISQLDNDLTKKFYYHFSMDELELFFNQLIIEFFKFQTIVLTHKNQVRANLKQISFPYSKLNKYQNELMTFVDDVESKTGQFGLVEAPTGIGKTISFLYPSLKNLKKYDRIFYLTAKNSGKEIVKDTLNDMMDDDLDMKAVILTAKEKICPLNEPACNPDDCPFARRYFDKLRTVLLESFNSDVKVFDLNYFMDVASKHHICPFEFQLDLSLYCDVIIGDYNYIYDPFVYLQRYVDKDLSNSLLLVDEGHNLLERVRGMYSSSISKNDIEIAKKSLKKTDLKTVKSNLRKLIKALEDNIKNFAETEIIKLGSIPTNLLKAISKCESDYRNTSLEEPKSITKEYKNLFLKLTRFVKIEEISDKQDNFIRYFKNTENELSLNILCISPTNEIYKLNNRFKNCLIFSATLTPFDYYNELYFKSSEKTFIKEFDSPFNPDKLNFNISPYISVKYNDRSFTINKVISQIIALVSSKPGNYFVFVPSYEYLNLLRSKLEIDAFDIVYQEKEMKEKDKDAFLSFFDGASSERSKVGVCVLGGSFSESINLVGEKLIGVIVIGVGMPSVSFENNEIKEYYDSIGLNGFYYAYTIPGMKNVTQAVGRLIRSSSDYGTVLLIDSRYGWSTYKNLFRKEWKNYKIIKNDYDIIRNLNIFYKKILNQ